MPGSWAYQSSKSECKILSAVFSERNLYRLLASNIACSKTVHASALHTKSPDTENFVRSSLIAARAFVAHVVKSSKGHKLKDSRCGTAPSFAFLLEIQV